MELELLLLKKKKMLFFRLFYFINDKQKKSISPIIRWLLLQQNSFNSNMRSISSNRVRMRGVGQEKNSRRCNAHFQLMERWVLDISPNERGVFSGKLVQWGWIFYKKPTIFRNEWAALLDLGVGNWVIARTLSSSGVQPPATIWWPRNGISDQKNERLTWFRRKLSAWRARQTRSTSTRCWANEVEWTTMSSKYAKHTSQRKEPRVWFINRWKTVGKFFNPWGNRLNWYNPSGVVKAVLSHCVGAKGTWNISTA